MQEFHVANLVQVDQVFQDNDQPFPVQPDSKYCGRECKVAYCLLFLRDISLHKHVKLWVLQRTCRDVLLYVTFVAFEETGLGRPVR